MNQDQQIQPEPKAGSLVPPRPNLGPEPWPEGSGWDRRAGSIGLAVGFVLLIVGLWLRNRRRARKRVTGEAGSSELANLVEPSPRERLIATSEQVRDALIREFGAPWGSKTTEEIGRGSALIERLDPEEVDRLITFLRLADRAKFAEGEPDLVEDWESHVVGLVERLKVSR